MDREQTASRQFARRPGGDRDVDRAFCELSVCRRSGDAAKLEQIRVRLVQLDQQSGQLADELLGAQADARQAVADVTAQQTKVAELQQQLGVVQDQVSALALQRLSSGGLGALLGDPAHLTSTVERDEYTKLAVSDGQDSIDQLGASVDALNKEQAKLVRQQAAADLKTAAVTQKQRDLDAKAQVLEQLKHATELQFGQDNVARGRGGPASRSARSPGFSGACPDRTRGRISCNGGIERKTR